MEDAAAREDDAASEEDGNSHTNNSMIFQKVGTSNKRRDDSFTLVGRSGDKHTLADESAIVAENDLGDANRGDEDRTNERSSEISYIEQLGSRKG